MLYGYFYKGQFIKFFLNFDLNDKSFFENMCRSMGHDPDDVQVFAYQKTLRNDESCIFDENMNMVVVDKEEIDIAAPTKQDEKAIKKAFSVKLGEVTKKQSLKFR